MNSLRQIAVVTAMNLSTLKERLGASLVVVVGIAAVVGVLLSVLSLSTGLLAMLLNGAAPDHVIVTSRDSRYAWVSSLPRAAVQAIVNSPGIVRGQDGKPLAAPDTMVLIPATKRGDGLDANVVLGGVTESFFALHPRLHLVEGRMFTPALREVIIGRPIHDQFVGYDLGSEIALQDGDWKIVGIYDDDGIWASGMLADAETAMSSFRRTNFNSVTVKIEPAGFEAFKASLTTNPELVVDVETEAANYARMFEFVTTLFKAVALWVGGVMALGAVFGALNTMYAAVSSRITEIATLRAIGFGAAPVVASILAESLLLALIGATIGAAVAWFAYNGKQHLISGTTFSMVISPGMFVFGGGLALLVGFIGALFPAIRAARLPVATALQGR